MKALFGMNYKFLQKMYVVKRKRFGELHSDLTPDLRVKYMSICI